MIDGKSVVHEPIMNLRISSGMGFGYNLREPLRPSAWDRLRRQVYSRANFVCEICGKHGSHHAVVHCHEVWKYDLDRKVQCLTGFQALCPDCHFQQHHGDGTVVEGVFGDPTNPHFLAWARLRGCRWQQDLSLLEAEPYRTWLGPLPWRRTPLKASARTQLCKNVYERANFVCEICGGRGKRHPVECHEVWEHDKSKNVQRLARFQALCPDCHDAKHAERNIVEGVWDRSNPPCVAGIVTRRFRWRQDYSLLEEEPYKSWVGASPFSDPNVRRASRRLKVL